MVQNDCHDPEWAGYLACHHAPLPLHTIQGSDRADEIRQLRQNRARLGQSVILSEVEGYFEEPRITRLRTRLRRAGSGYHGFLWCHFQRNRKARALREGLEQSLHPIPPPPTPPPP